MTSILTLDARKKAQVEQIRGGIAVLRGQLAEYGRAHGSKFWIYGSAATGALHHDSDVDILVDFEKRNDVAALSFAEAACSRLRLKADIRRKNDCTPAFLARIPPTAHVLP